MDLFRRLFQKSAPRGLFSFVFPQTPASLQNPEFLKAYRGWVYACVKRKADSIATTEFTLQQKQGDEWAEVTSGPALKALDLLTTVNPFLASDGLYRGTSSFLDLVGNSFWYVAYNGRKEPVELWQLDPTKVEVIRDDRNYVAGWIYTTPKGKRERLSVYEVIPFQEFNPLDPFKGMGPTEAGALQIDSDRYRAEWGRNFFANSAIPSLVLKTKQNLTDEQYDRLITGWIARFQGVQNAHKPAILEGEMDVHELNSTLKDMDLTAQKREDRDQILAIFGVPKVLLGISETGDSRSDAEGAEYVFSKYTLAPRMRFLATTLSEFYLPLWGLSPTKFRLYAADCVPRNDEMDLKRTESGLAFGYSTINEVRAQEGKKPVEGGDTVFVPSTWKPIDLAINPPEPVLTPGAAPKSPAKSVTKDAAKDPVAGRVKFVLKEIKKRTPEFAAIFAKQRDQVVKRLAAKDAAKTLTRKDIDETEISNELVRLLFADWNDWIGLLLNPTRGALDASLTEGGRTAIAQLALDQTFDLLNPRVVSWLETHALQHATSVNDTVKDELRRLIVDGVTEGQGAEDIAESIGSFFDEQSQWRALRIARTEVIAGYAEGSLEGYRQSGIVAKKQWLTAGDGLVDLECELNAQQGAVLLDVNFASGHHAPPVHPNCRCVLQPVTEEE